MPAESVGQVDSSLHAYHLATSGRAMQQRTQGAGNASGGYVQADELNVSWALLTGARI